MRLKVMVKSMWAWRPPWATSCCVAETTGVSLRRPIEFQPRGRGGGGPLRAVGARGVWTDMEARSQAHLMPPALWGLDRMTASDPPQPQLHPLMLLGLGPLLL